MINQYSEAWFQAHLGCLTASRIALAVARTKTGWGASRANLMADLIAERLTCVPAESVTSDAMQWGIDTEDEARVAYEFYADVDVTPAGFALHPSIEFSGASPDGFVGEDGLIEIKCPKTATHIDTLLGAKLPGKYVMQMQWQMACTMRKWCDFVSYDPRMPEAMRLHVRRIARDDKLIASLSADAKEFLGELVAKHLALCAQYMNGESPITAKLHASLISHGEMMRQVQERPSWAS